MYKAAVFTHLGVPYLHSEAVRVGKDCFKSQCEGHKNIMCCDAEPSVNCVKWIMYLIGTLLSIKSVWTLRLITLINISRFSP